MPLDEGLHEIKMRGAIKESPKADSCSVSERGGGGGGGGGGGSTEERTGVE